MKESKKVDKVNVMVESEMNDKLCMAIGFPLSYPANSTVNPMPCATPQSRACFSSYNLAADVHIPLCPTRLSCTPHYKHSLLVQCSSARAGISPMRQW
jgi:hypothetical protein